MFFTPDMAEAFGDWLELDRIRDALTTARPQLAGALSADAQRPLLRITRPGGDALLVVRSAEEGTGRWIIGIPGQPAPVLRDADSLDAVVDVVLSALG